MLKLSAYRWFNLHLYIFTTILVEHHRSLEIPTWRNFTQETDHSQLTFTYTILFHWKYKYLVVMTW